MSKVFVYNKDFSHCNLYTIRNKQIDLFDSMFDGYDKFIILDKEEYKRFKDLIHFCLSRSGK